MSSVPFFLLFFAAVEIYSIWRGGGPERIIAIAYLIALAASATVGILHIQGHFRSVPDRLLLVDGLLLIVLTMVAVRANRWWVIPAAACQLVAVLVHAGKLLDTSMFFISYGFLTKIWSWPMVALLALGTWAQRRRMARGIFVPDWKPISAPQPFPRLLSRRTG